MNINDFLKDIPDDNDQHFISADPKAMTAYANLQNHLLSTFGYLLHITVDAASDFENAYINAHTHGLLTSCNHPDIQIVYGLDLNDAANILHNCIRHIKNGVRFNTTDTYKEILADLPVRFVNAIESERSVLRIITTDQNGYWPEDPECDEYMKNAATLHI